MNRQVTKNKIRKSVAYLASLFIFTLVSGLLLLQMPPVQHYIVNRLLGNVLQKTDFDIKINSFSLWWFDRLEIKGATVIDPEKNEMIRAGEINVNFSFFDLLRGGQVNIDAVTVDSTHVWLTYIAETDTTQYINFTVFIDRLNSMASTGSGGNPPVINIGEGLIYNSRISYIDQDQDSIKNGFDYYHFTANIDEANLNQFLVLGDTIAFNVSSLKAHDNVTGLKVHDLTTFFRISQLAMEFEGLNVKANRSVITDTVIFSYKRQSELSDFNTKVNIHAHLSNTYIDPYDLSLFAPGAEHLGLPMHIQGVFDGKIKKFKVKDMDIAMGNTRLSGSLDIDGLPDFQETFIILDAKNSIVHFKDLNFIENKELKESLDQLGTMSLNGKFIGYPNDFVANGEFRSKIGTIKSDINLKVNENTFNKSSYSGTLELIGFDMGRYFKDTLTFQKVSLKGYILGSGLSLENADFKLNGQIHSLGIKGYTYSNIVTDAHFASSFFNGFAKIDDPNLELSVKGSIDLRNHADRFHINASVDTAYLGRLHLITEDVFLQTNLQVNMSGLHLDSLEGSIDLQDFTIMNKGQKLNLSNISLQAEKQSAQRVISLTSSVLDASVSGNFLFSDLYVDAERMVHEVSLNIINDPISTSQYYKSKNIQPKDYQASYWINFKNIQPATSLLNIPLSVSKKSKITGSFSNGKTNIFKSYALFDTLDFNGNRFYKSEVDITLSKLADSANVLAMVYLNSSRQSIGKDLYFKDLIAEAIWNKGHVDFNFHGSQETKDNFITLNGTVDFQPDSTVIRLLPSTLHLLERDWSFVPENRISLKGKEWHFHHLNVLNEKQTVQILGDISESPQKKLSFLFKDIDLSILNIISLNAIAGTLNANIEVGNLYRKTTMENQIAIDKLLVNNYLIGDVSGNNIWDEEEKKFNLDFLIKRNNLNIVQFTGDYNPSNKKSPLNLNAVFDKADLKIAEPFFIEYISDLKGTLSGTYQITGDIDEPLIRGEGSLKNGFITINYLKTTYRFSGILGFSPNSIYGKNIELMDGFSGKGTLVGSITHKNFNGMDVNLHSNIANLQVLNTTSKDNELFYGQGFATGQVSFTGPLSNIRISSTARSEKKTRIYIPIEGTAVVEKKDFINFVSFTDSTFVQNLKGRGIRKKLSPTGITLDLNLDITPDAYCEIIFDIKAGDIIRGRGNGGIKLQMDTKGEFNMFGFIDFIEGWYNFTLYDIINKEFEIQKGSRITWYGDPYGAQLDISASYNQMASLAPILNDPVVSSSPQVRRKYPVQVLLRIDGPMLSPQINFDIQAKDLPQNITVENRPVNLAFSFNAFKNKLDEQELKRQVFSLIILRRFSPPESFNTSGSVVSSVSELLSNQLSNWLSQVDENLEVNVDIATMDQETFNTFQLRLSYTFLNGRLRVTRDGTFTNQYASNQGISGIAGDWTVDYLLTQDGKLKVKMYNRTNVNPINNTLGTQNAMTTGVSLQFVQNFNELKDLLRSSRNKNKEKQPEPIEVNDEALKEEGDEVDN